MCANEHITDTAQQPDYYLVQRVLYQNIIGANNYRTPAPEGVCVQETSRPTSKYTKRPSVPPLIFLLNAF